MDIKEAESRIQTQCYTWFHNTYPDLRGLLCYNLNNSTNRITGSINKGMGLQKGRADLVMYYQGKAYHIEMKTPDRGQESAQRAWQANIEAHGFSYYVCRSIEEFTQLIRSIVRH